MAKMLGLIVAVFFTVCPHFSAKSSPPTVFSKERFKEVYM